jgi:hypothetical protein
MVVCMRTFSQNLVVDTEEDIEIYWDILPTGRESNQGTLEWEAGFQLHKHDTRDRMLFIVLTNTIHLQLAGFRRQVYSDSQQNSREVL